MDLRIDPPIIKGRKVTEDVQPMVNYMVKQGCEVTNTDPKTGAVFLMCSDDTIKNMGKNKL